MFILTLLFVYINTSSLLNMEGISDSKPTVMLTDCCIVYQEESKEDTATNFLIKEIPGITQIVCNII